MAAALLPSEQPGVCPLLAPPPNVAHGIVSQAVLTAPGLRVTLFHFAAGQELSEHTTPARALLQVVSGSADVDLPDRTCRLESGDLVHLPPRCPHAVRAAADLTLLVVQATPPGETARHAGGA
jgi:quercetin dioxygenase-like cupin family protein